MSPFNNQFIRRACTFSMGAALFASSLGLATEPLPSPDKDGLDAVKKWSWERTMGAKDAYLKSGRSYYPSPRDWANEVVYQIVVDRFNDGDKSNNSENLEPHQVFHQDGSMSGISNYRHGGDLQGIINRMDYLQDLGITTLWITPILEGNGSYHGYCTTDFTKIDKGFGDPETLRQLTDQAHIRGMKVVLDIVVNHVCDPKTKYDEDKTPFQGWAYDQCTADMNARYWNGGGHVRGRRDVNFSDDFFPPFRSQDFLTRCGYKAGDFSGHGNGALFGDFSDAMMDLDTQNWDFQEIFANLHKYWIADADIDGFRVDAAKHVTADFIAKLSVETRKFADSLGKNNFFLVGEVAGIPFEQAVRLGKMRSNWLHPGDRSAKIPEALRNRLHNLYGDYTKHLFFGYPGLNAVYDFAHSGSASEVMRQAGSPMRIKNWFYNGSETDHSQCNEGYCELIGNGDPHLNWNVLEIHDWPRFSIFNRRADQHRIGLGYLLAAQGTPVLYYGVEQGLDGNCNFNRLHVPQETIGEVEGICRDFGHFNHTRYRQDMFVDGPWRLGSVEPEIDNLAGIGDRLNKDSFPFDPYTSQHHSTFRFTKKMIEIRKSCTSLKRGQTYFRAVHDSFDGGLLAFSRIHGSDESLVLVNNSDLPIKVEALELDKSINEGRPFAKFKNLFNAFEEGSVGKLGGGMGLYLHAVDANTGNKYPYSIPGHSVAVFVLENNLGPYRNDLGAHTCNY